MPEYSGAAYKPTGVTIRFPDAVRVPRYGLPREHRGRRVVDLYLAVYGVDVKRLNPRHRSGIADVNNERGGGREGEGGRVRETAGGR